MIKAHRSIATRRQRLQRSDRLARYMTTDSTASIDRYFQMPVDILTRLQDEKYEGEWKSCDLIGDTAENYGASFKVCLSGVTISV